MMKIHNTVKHAKAMFELYDPEGKDEPPTNLLRAAIAAMDEKSRYAHLKAIDDIIAFIKDAEQMDRVVRVLKKLHLYIKTNSSDFAIFSHDGQTYKIPADELQQYKVILETLRMAATKQETFTVDVHKPWHYVVAVLAVIVLFVIGAFTGYYYRGKV